MESQHIKRRKRAKGRWMKLTNRTLMVEYMKASDFSQARLGRYAGVSRQFINQLANGDRTTCTKEVGQRIEEALRVLPTTLFVEQISPVVQPSVARQTRRSA